MNGKQIAAIAAILIVAAPIGLGYVLSIDETVTESWQESEKMNLSDVLLNSEMPYFSEMSGPLNNGQLEYVVRDTHQGVTSTTIKAPKYVSISDTVSSIPVFESVSAVTSNAPDKKTTTGHDLVPGHSVEIAYGREIRANADAYLIKCSEMSQLTVANGSTYGTTFGPFLRDGETYNWDTGRIVYTFNNELNGLTIASDRSPTFEIYVYDCEKLNVGTATSFAVQWGVDGLVSAKFRDGSKTSFMVPSNGSAYFTGSILSIDNNVVASDVLQVQCGVLGTARNQIYFTYNAPNGKFANPADGWQVPVSSDPFYAFWSNSQANREISMFVHLINGERVNLRAYTTAGTAGSDFYLSMDNGQMIGSMGGVQKTLGSYNNVHLILSTGGIRVSGLTEWPTMGATPVALNSISFDDVLDDEIFKVRIQPNVPGGFPEFRIDKTLSTAGTFPITEDKNLEINNLWPGKSYNLTLTSVGVSGSSFEFGGVTFPVEDGTITINDEKIRIAGVKLASVLNGAGTYDCSINGVHVGTTDAPSNINFGGMWSMTVSGSIVELVTTSHPTWVPGGFGLDRDSVLLVGIAAATMAVIGLGMVGNRSGGKMAWLLLTCGGAVAIILIMV